jgi:hypothetical protein
LFGGTFPRTIGIETKTSESKVLSEEKKNKLSPWEGSAGRCIESSRKAASAKRQEAIQKTAGITGPSSGLAPTLEFKIGHTGGHRV